jgi:hypothetical protein
MLKASAAAVDALNLLIGGCGRLGQEEPPPTGLLQPSSSMDAAPDRRMRKPSAGMGRCH